MSGQNSELIDWARVRELREEIGPEEFTEVVALFLSETEAMADALPRATPETLEAELHALKGAALNLGFSRLAAACAEGERLSAAGRCGEVALAPILATFFRARSAFREGLRAEQSC